MKYPEITHLYKYLKLEKYGNLHEHTLKILTERKIWYPRPERFNDPFDCDLWLDDSVTFEEYLVLAEIEGRRKGKTKVEIDKKIASIVSRGQTVPTEYRNNVKAGVEEFHRSTREYGVLVLSSICDSIPMWAHYADTHKGICIEFERHDDNVLGDYRITRPIRYEKDYPVISYLDIVRNPNGSTSRRTLTTKSAQWKYENEWRALITTGDMKFALPGEISAVIFGIRTEDEHKREIAKLLRGCDKIGLKQVVKVENQFKLRIVN